MKGKLFITASLMGALLLTSCSNELPADLNPSDGLTSVTFKLATPAGEKINYTRALHDEAEYKINSLTLYEYEVGKDEEGKKTTSLVRIMNYPDGLGRDVITPVDNGDGSYTFSITIPASYEGKTYSYHFVANNATINVKLGESVDRFHNDWYSAIILNEKTVIPDSEDENGEQTSEPVTVYPTADQLASPEKGIAMTGVASFDGNEEITMGAATNPKGEVNLKRIVSRIDIRYQTPNLKITKAELQGAPVKTYLWPLQDEQGNPLFADVATVKTELNSNISLPLSYLKDNESETEVNLKKAFYLYERSNSDESSAIVHLEYTVDANGTEYEGSLDIPFRLTSGDKKYIDTERNHLYTIILGNGAEPIAGKVSATLIVDDWNLIEIDEPLTD